MSQYYGIEADFLNIFGPDFDRLGLPRRVHFIAAGCGGNGILIKGSEKTAIIDGGMAYCADETIDNIRKYTDKLDIIICSHSHYDHIGALPYMLDAFPEAKVYGSAKCERVFRSDNAKAFIKMMGENARELYGGDPDYEIKTQNLRVDTVLNDGDEISLGKESIIAFATKGHTDCSMTFLLKPIDLMFTSESTGIMETMDYIHTPILKSFSDVEASVKKCMSLGAKQIFLPHFGLIPSDFNDKYFQLFVESCKEKISYVKSMLAVGLSDEEMQERFINRYMMPSGEKMQPFKAYAENAQHLLTTLVKYIKENNISDFWN